MASLQCFSFVVVLAFFSSGCLAQEKECSSSPPAEVATSNVLQEFVALINTSCAENNGYCDHNIVIPKPLLFSDKDANISIKYSAIKAIEIDGDEDKEKLYRGNIMFKYQNLTMNITTGDETRHLEITDNLLQIAFKMNVSDFGDLRTCWFKWLQLDLKQFSYTTKDSLDEETTSLLTLEHLQELLNDPKMKQELSNQISLCNPESFINQMTAAFIVIAALKGLASALSTLIDSVLC